MLFSVLTAPTPITSFEYAPASADATTYQFGITYGISVDIKPSALVGEGVTSCTGSGYPFTSGLSVNSTTCAISGKLTFPSGATSASMDSIYSVTATNNAGSKTAQIRLLTGTTLAGSTPSTASITCNSSGIATGCSSSLPYSCSNNTTTCYSTRAACLASTSCADNL